MSIMERVFYKAHDKVTKLTLRKSTPYQRTIVENAILFLAVISFSAVILCHRTFVYRGGVIKSEAMSARGWNIPSMCLKSVEGFREDVDVTHIVIYDVDLDFNLNLKMDNHHVDIAVAQGGYDYYHSVVSDLCPTDDHNEFSTNNSCSAKYESSSFVTFIEPLSGIQQTPTSKTSNKPISCSSSCYTNIQEERQRIQNSIFKSNITYSFSLSRGFLFLPPDTLSSRNISSQYVVIYSDDEKCFGDDPLLNYVGRRFAGRDTIALNWVLGFRNGTAGFIHTRNDIIIDLEKYLNEYSFRWPTKMLQHQFKDGAHDTSSQEETTSTPSNQNENSNEIKQWYHHYFIFKIGVLVSSLFLFFATTTLVSFTLRETQDRMVHFTLQLQMHIRSRQPYGGLIFTHVIENMVFAPIMIGIIFFLTDCCYNGDKFLAFVILSGVWICEVFSAISMRTIHSSIYYPQVFFAYFTLFHVYYFSCPFGFSYAALLSTVLFQLHSMIFFWNRYELPAIVSGRISSERPRMTLNYNNNIHHATDQTAGNGQNGSVSHGSNASIASAGQEIQRLRPSYPSMSSLGRMSSFEGYLVFMDGEVVMRQNSRS